MATSRKTSAARSKPARSGARKAAKTASAGSKSRVKSAPGKVQTRKAKPAKPARPGQAIAPPKPKLPLKPAKPGHVVAVAPGKAPPPGKALPKGSGKKSALRPMDKKPAPEVRPLGVLPPESMARSAPRPASHVVNRPRSTPPASTPPRATSQGATRVTEQDLKDFEGRLLTERRKILKEMGHLETTVLKVNPRDSAGDLSGYSFHMADAGTDAMEREKAFMFASTEGRTLVEINEALRRLYRGEYGTCDSCGKPIGRARLEAMPHAKLCLACKEKEEREQRGAV